MKSKIVMPLLLLICLGGCKSASGSVTTDESVCAKYRSYVKNHKSVEHLIDQLDASIFSRTLTPEEVGTGSLAGPGRAALRGNARTEILADDFSNDDVRLLGEDKFRPDAVFIEQKAYHGLLIVRQGKQRELKSLGEVDNWLQWENGRVAVGCYHDH